MTNEYEWIGNYDRPRAELSAGGMTFGWIALALALVLMIF